MFLSGLGLVLSGLDSGWDWASQGWILVEFGPFWVGVWLLLYISGLEFGLVWKFLVGILVEFGPLQLNPGWVWSFLC